jgi:hypothetical protein
MKTVSTVFLIITMLALGAFCGTPLPGQIMVDPDNPSWLVYNKDDNNDGKKDPFFMVGPGDPEGFLYKSDHLSSWNQGSIIDHLKANGGNAIYFQVVRSHGGDGGSSENPFVGSNPSNGLDQSKLNQWEVWFTEMDNAGICIYMFFYDDGAVPFGTGNSVSSGERGFLEGIVNKFEHHKNLIWCVAEEYGEKYSVSRISAIAQVIRTADDHDHVIAVHQNNGLNFAFKTDPNIDQFNIQYNLKSISELHSGMVNTWSSSSGKYNLNLGESDGHFTSNRTDVRRKNWAIAMGGAYIMLYKTYVSVAPSTGQLNDCRILQNFFEATNVNKMAPHDELASGGTKWVLAKPGDSYIAYADNLSGKIGITNMTAGTYGLLWLDIPTGTTRSTQATVGAGTNEFDKPSGIGNEVAVWITSSGITSNFGTRMGMSNREIIHVYPNPFSTSVFFEMRNTNSGLRNMQVAIYDIQGKLLQEFKNSSSGYAWHAQDQAVGTYVIKMKSDKKEWTNKVSLIK